MAKEDLDFLEDEDEGIRNIREAKKAAEKRARELEAEVEQMKAERASAAATSRTAEIQGILSQAGLPSKVAGFYPAEAEVSTEAVTQWASTELELSPVVSPASSEEDRSQTVWDRYDRFVRGAFSTGSVDEVQALQDKAFKGVMDALGPVVSEDKIANKPFLPTPEEIKEAQEIAQTIQSHRHKYESLVKQGRAEAIKPEFGGRYDPPYHANRTQQLLDLLNRG